MKKEKVHLTREQLSAFLDGDLDVGKKAEIEKHLPQCVECRQEVEQLAELKNGLAELAQVEPSRDLWPAIQRRQREGRYPQKPSWFRRLWTVPASAMVGAAAALVIVWLVTGRPSDSQKDSRGPVGALQVVLKAENDYRQAIDSLSQALAGSQTDQNPELAELMKKGLSEIDQSIERCRQLIKTDPNNAEAQESLLAAYQHKVDLLTDWVGQNLSD